MLVCPLSIFTALALVSVVGEKGKTGVKPRGRGEGGWVLPYITYTGMCCPTGS